MLTSKRQEWILQMIKGPDITSVGNCAGHYTSKSTIHVTAQGQRALIRPADVLDLSNPQFLIVHAAAGEKAIAWEQIESLEFDEQVTAPPNLRPPTPASAHRIFSFPLGKKVV